MARVAQVVVFALLAAPAVPDQRNSPASVASDRLVRSKLRLVQGFFRSSLLGRARLGHLLHDLGPLSSHRVIHSRLRRRFHAAEGPVSNGASRRSQFVCGQRGQYLAKLYEPFALGDWVDLD